MTFITPSQLFQLDRTCSLCENQAKWFDKYDENSPAYCDKHHPGRAFVREILEMNEKTWNETEKGKQQLLDILNDTFWFQPDGSAVRKDESCEKCKNELVACVCMAVDDER